VHVSPRKAIGLLFLPQYLLVCCLREDTIAERSLAIFAHGVPCPALGPPGLVVFNLTCPFR